MEGCQARGDFDPEIQPADPFLHATAMHCNGWDSPEEVTCLFVYERKRPNNFFEVLAAFDNLYCVSTGSGKVTSEIMMDWYSEILESELEPNSIGVVG